MYKTYVCTDLYILTIDCNMRKILKFVSLRQTVTQIYIEIVCHLYFPYSFVQVIQDVMFQLNKEIQKLGCWKVNLYLKLEHDKQMFTFINRLLMTLKALVFIQIYLPEKPLFRKFNKHALIYHQCEKFIQTMNILARLINTYNYLYLYGSIPLPATPYHT